MSNRQGLSHRPADSAAGVVDGAHAEGRLGLLERPAHAAVARHGVDLVRGRGTVRVRVRGMIRVWVRVRVRGMVRVRVRGRGRVRARVRVRVRATHREHQRACHVCGHEPHAHVAPVVTHLPRVARDQ